MYVLKRASSLLYPTSTSLENNINGKDATTKQGRLDSPRNKTNTMNMMSESLMSIFFRNQRSYHSPFERKASPLGEMKE